MSLILDSKIEAILFFKSEPISIKKLAQILEVSEEDIQNGISMLKEKLLDRGVSLIHKDKEVMLCTSVESSEMIEGMIKEELSKDLGKAGLETLSIVLYRGPVTRSRIDYIRGVSSTFILRNLLVRGLVERISNPSNQRSFLYRPTFELLSYLGVSNIEDLPEYNEVKNELKIFETQEVDNDLSTGGQDKEKINNELNTSDNHYSNEIIENKEVEEKYEQQ